MEYKLNDKKGKKGYLVHSYLKGAVTYKTASAILPPKGYLAYGTFVK